MKYSTVRLQSNKNLPKRGNREGSQFYNTVLLLLQRKITVKSMHEKHKAQNTVQEKRPAEIDRRDSRESIASRDRCKQSNKGC